MANVNINVDESVLEAEIENLNNLLYDVQCNDLEIKGQGYTKEYLDVVNSCFSGLIQNVGYLIENTVSFLSEAKNGFLELDEETAKAIEDLTNEVLEDE